MLEFGIDVNMRSPWICMDGIQSQDKVEQLSSRRTLLEKLNTQRYKSQIIIRFRQRNWERVHKL